MEDLLARSRQTDVGDELYPAREETPERVILKSREPEQLDKVLQKLTDEIDRLTAVREARRSGIWCELHAFMVERMRAGGLKTIHHLLRD
ncbi:hypothetical protein NLM27_26995 [Bradyrhizobium sp. CCGB12]|uniref:hypothetical protein n=1 Tax=Bradyrhizobium sp. CCGB12 TaxID=2949632 RepID=UPI0020B26839|nr:hypothetical protein [Bradyrhizobium sp. CCGB12]MCP3392397.1 hypothetical protein [Bradyrhizobium sp. CCGB12]